MEKEYIKDGRAEFFEGRLSDLKEWYFKSCGLGDLIGCADSNESYKIVKYKGGNGYMYAIGI